MDGPSLTLTEKQRGILLDALIRMHAFSDQRGRDTLLENFPDRLRASVPRSDIAITDLQQIVRCVVSWGVLDNGKEALFVLLENALFYCRGSQVGRELEALQTELAIALTRSIVNPPPRNAQPSSPTPPPPRTDNIPLSPVSSPSSSTFTPNQAPSKSVIPESPSEKKTSNWRPLRAILDAARSPADVFADTWCRQLQPKTELRGHTSSVLSLAVSPDGRFVVSGDRDGRVWLWDLEKRTKPHISVHGSPTEWVTALTITPDGRRVLSGGTEGIVREWDTRSGKSLIFSVDELGSDDNTSRVQDSVNDYKTDNSLIRKTNRIVALTITPDGQQFFICTPRRVFLFDSVLEKESYFHYKWSEYNKITTIAVAPAGHRFFAAEGSYIFYVDYVRNISRPYLWTNYGGSYISCLTFSPNGEWLLYGVTDGNVRRGKAKGSPLSKDELSVGQHDRSVTTMVALPYNNHVLSGSADGTIRLWDFRRARLLRIWKAHDGGVTALSLLPDGQGLVSAGHDRVVRIWRLVQP
jgi:WD40 repeat protein